MLTIQLEVNGTPAEILKGLRAVKGVKSARLHTADGAAPTPAGAVEKLPAGPNAYQVESLPGSDVRAELASTMVGRDFSCWS